MSRSIAGLGIGGICVTSLSFRTTDDMSLRSNAAAVTVTGIDGLPTFYINKRSYEDGVWTIEALDRAAFLDLPVDMSGCAKYRNGTMYAVTDFVSRIQRDCGFSSVTIPYSPFTDATLIPCEAVDGKSYQSVLTSMALAYGGFFCVTSGTVLVFHRFDNVPAHYQAAHYSRLRHTGTFTYGSVKATDGQTTNTYGSTTPTLTVNNEFVDFRNNVCVSAYQAMVTQINEGIRIDNAVLATALTVPLANSTVSVGGTSYRFSSISARLTGDTLLLSLSNELPSTGEINRRGRLQKELDEKVSTERVYNTIQTAYQDGIVVVPNEVTS